MRRKGRKIDRRRKEEEETIADWEGRERSELKESNIRV
jgi:hypothetical protein